MGERPDAGLLLQEAYETLDAFERAIRAYARGDLNEQGSDAARTAMGHKLDGMAEALAGSQAEVARLADRLALARTACRCDPPGSGEEYCTGHCVLNAEIERLRAALAARHAR